MADGAIVAVSGLADLARDFRKMSKDIHQDLVFELEEAAGPVRKDAEQLALSEIRNLPPTPDYAEMRIGVVRSTFTVYMVPAWKTTRRRPRPNLGGLLMGRAMDPALERNQGKVIDRVDDLLARLGGEYDFY